MALSLHNLKPNSRAKRKAQRVGRGGKRGTYSGRGLKGQRARSGGRGGLKRLGMRQLIERSHKLKGFKSIHSKPVVVSLADLDKAFKSGDKVTPQVLLKKKLITSVKPAVKILANGQLKIKLNVSGCLASRTARQAIEGAGGKFQEITVKADKKLIADRGKKAPESKK